MIPESSDRAARHGSTSTTSRSPTTSPRRRSRATAVIKLNGGLGTSMGMDRAKSLLCVRRGLSFLDIIARQVLHLRKQYDATLPLLFMNSFRTSDDTMAALARYDDLAGRRPAAGVPAEQGAQAARRRPAAGVVAHATPTLEWCPPGHGDIYTALRGTGLLDRLIEAGYRYVFVSNSDNLGAVPDARVAGWFAASGAPFAIEAVRRTASDRKGGHFARRKPRRPDRAARDRADPRRGQGGARRPRAAPLLLDQQPVVRPGRDEARPRRARRHPRAAADPQRQARRPRRPDVPGGDPDRDRDGRRDRGVRGRAARSRSAATGSCRSRRPTTCWCCAPTSTTSAATTSSTRSGEQVPFVELDGRHYKLVGEFDKRFPDGAPSLREAQSLTVEGDWTFGQRVRVVGDVELEAGKAAAGRARDRARRGALGWLTARSPSRSTSTGSSRPSSRCPTSRSR